MLAKNDHKSLEEALLPTSVSPRSTPSSSRDSSPMRAARSSYCKILIAIAALVTASLLLFGLFASEGSFRVPEYVNRVRNRVSGQPKVLPVAPPVTRTLLPEEILERLDGQNIHFIGDSLTRYQYTQLIHYLETGIITDTNNATTLIDGVYDPVNEKSWDSWNHFFEGTSRAYANGTGSGGGNASCDCYRQPGVALEAVLENRYYHNRNVKLNYHWYTRDIGICSLRGKATWDVQATNPVPDWCYTLIGFVRGLFEHAKENNSPFTLVLNAGLHAPMPKIQFDEIYSMFAAHDAAPSGRTNDTSAKSFTPLLVWKRTTPVQVSPQTPEYDRDLHLDLSSRSSPNFKILDTRTIVTGALGYKKPDEIYWDALHFYAPIYQAFTTSLVDMVADRHVNNTLPLPTADGPPIV